MNKLLPHGCDAQGRYATRPWPSPAEACTEIGAEPPGRHRTCWLIRLWLRVRRALT